jgi:hypothetical protein
MTIEQMMVNLQKMANQPSNTKPISKSKNN